MCQKFDNERPHFGKHLSVTRSHTRDVMTYHEKLISSQNSLRIQLEQRETKQLIDEKTSLLPLNCALLNWYSFVEAPFVRWKLLAPVRQQSTWRHAKWKQLYCTLSRLSVAIHFVCSFGKLNYHRSSFSAHRMSHATCSLCPKFKVN